MIEEKIEKIFGVNAGKVWNTLHEMGKMTAKDIAKSTKLKDNDVFGALGWLAKENKIRINRNLKSIYYELKE